MHLVGALDGLGSGQKIRPVLGLHETVCTGAADGYARMTQRPSLVLLHLGPGLSNGLANLHNARRSGSPIVVIIGGLPCDPSGSWGIFRLGPSAVCIQRESKRMTPRISGDMATWVRPMDPVLNSDIEALASTVSCWVRTCRSPEDLPRDMSEAIQATAPS